MVAGGELGHSIQQPGLGKLDQQADVDRRDGGDFTGDGLPDIVGRNSAGKWYLAENSGTGFVNRSWGDWKPRPASGWV